MPDRLATIRRTLEAHGQEHLPRFWDELQAAQRAELLQQIEEIQFEALDELIEKYVRKRPALDLPTDLEPAPYYPSDPASQMRSYDAANYRAAGEALIRSGKVAAF